MVRCDTTFLLHSDFERQARTTPEAVAVQFGDATATYAEIHESSERLAAVLRHRGIGDGCFVGLHIERSIRYVIGLLAILKSNSAVVPLPPSFPRARLAEILQHSALQAVIDDEDSPLDPSLGASVIHFSDVASGGGEPLKASAGNPALPAFVLCSSGSTGKPKMIVRSHRSFFHRLCWTWTQHPYEAGELCCQKSTMTTTHAIYELFEPLLRGIPVLIVPDAETRDLERFWNTLRSRSISRLLIVPSALQVSLDLPGFTAPPLKVMVLMGEYVHHKLVGAAIDAFPPVTRMYSIYGSTEASSTLVCDLKEAYRPNRELPLGKPIADDVRAYVLDSGLQPVESGQAGLLHLGGPALMSEYYRDAALTASVFVRAPHTDDRLYDTHDQVRLLADGNVEFIGRTDDTVKVRGFRVDLQEVERVLLLHPQIRQAAVLLTDGDTANAALLAFFTPDSVDRAELFRLLRDNLPTYMIPSGLVGLAALPRTASGKTDRRKLLEDYKSRAADDSGGGVGQSVTEAEVSRIWRQLLKHGNVESGSSFFEVGGTSLTAFAAIQRLRAAFALDRDQLPDQSIYQFPTVREMAVRIDGLKSGTAAAAEPGNAILVRLRKGQDAARAPLFLIASAGGTLGAYEKLAEAMDGAHDIIGVRDPYVWGERDPTQGFRNWVAMYVGAIRKRQPEGPYHVLAYSSAGAFGYEIARQLRLAGAEVALLALIDPFGLDRPSSDAFGYKVMQARFKKRHFKMAVRLEGWLRGLLARSHDARGPARTVDDLSVTASELQLRIDEAKQTIGDVAGFSALLELNSGLPFGITSAELSKLEPGDYFPAFLSRAKQAAPEIDLDMLDHVFGQYYGLQVPAQQRYRLQRYDGPVVLFEPDGVNSGLVKAQLRPHVRQLTTRRLKLGPQAELRPALSAALSAGLRDHYLCMRNDRFVRALAAELKTRLG